MFDWDGVVVDSSARHGRSWEILAAQREREEIYRTLVRDKGIEPLSGGRELLSMLQATGLPRAIGSSTERADLDCLLDLTDLRVFSTSSSRAKKWSTANPAHPFSSSPPDDSGPPPLIALSSRTPRGDRSLPPRRHAGACLGPRRAPRRPPRCHRRRTRPARGRNRNVESLGGPEKNLIAPLAHRPDR